MTHPITIITITPRRAEGTAGPVLVGLRWRGETDGRASGTLAFQAEVEPPPGEAVADRLAGLYLNAGFTADPDGVTYAARAPHPHTPLALVRGLEDAGFVVRHLRCVPDALTTTPGLDALHQLRAEYVEIAADIREASLMGAVETLTDGQLLAAAAGYGELDLPEAGNRIINTAITLAIIEDRD